MTSGPFRFETFTLDTADRRLLDGGAPVELNARYFDALALMVREAGALVTKDRFMDEVWSGIPVTDEALTQCIRTLRKRLGDDAAHPRFIETVPKHGYRFVAPVERAETAPAASPVPTAPARATPHFWPDFLRLGIAGMVGGGLAGIAGGILYGSLGATQPDVGALSVLLVLASATLLVALLGAAGVSFGIAATANRPAYWQIFGGALGGLIVGAVVSLLARDAFTLLVGYTPIRVTGAPEGALLGAATGLGVWLGGAGRPSIRRGAIIGALAGAAAGLSTALLGGKLMAGTLALLSTRFPESRFRVDGIGALFGEQGFGPVTEATTASLEGGLFCTCVAAAIVMARKLMAEQRNSEPRDVHSG